MGIPFGSGSSDPQARNIGNVRSKPTELKKYDPPATIARDFAKRAALQVENANRIETQTALGDNLLPAADELEDRLL